MCVKELNILGPHTAVPAALLEEGGIHNDSAGGGLAWQNLSRHFSSQAPMPSSLSFYLLCGGGEGSI